MERPHLYIAGCRGIPARYGGFETFVEQLAPRLARDGYPVSVTCEGEKAQSGHRHGSRHYYLARLSGKQAPKGRGISGR